MKVFLNMNEIYSYCHLRVLNEDEKITHQYFVADAAVYEATLLSF